MNTYFMIGVFFYILNDDEGLDISVLIEWVLFWPFKLLSCGDKK
jgi:hypothetical protein